MGIWNKPLIPCLIGASLALGAPAAFAQAQTGIPGWYVGGSLGEANISDINCPPGFTCDDKDTAWKIFGGYQINRTFAAEIGLTDLGEFGRNAGPVVLPIESQAWDLVGVASWPLGNQFSLYGKLGLYYADTKANSNIGPSGDETNTGWTFGAGAQYDFTRNVGMRAEWQRYNDVGGGNVGGKSDVDVLSLGVLFRF